MKPFNRALFDGHVEASLKDLNTYAATGAPQENIHAVVAVMATNDDGTEITHASVYSVDRLHHMGDLGEAILGATIRTSLSTVADMVLHVCSAYVSPTPLPRGEIETAPTTQRGYAITLYSHHDTEVRAYTVKDGIVTLHGVEHHDPVVTERAKATHETAEGHTVH